MPITMHKGKRTDWEKMKASFSAGLAGNVNSDAPEGPPLP